MRGTALLFALCAAIARALRAYADLLVGCALGSGTGVHPEQVVGISIPDTAKPLLLELQRSVLEHKAYPRIQYLPSLTDKQFFDCASDAQLTWFPEKWKPGQLRTVLLFEIRSCK